MNRSRGFTDIRESEVVLINSIMLVVEYCRRIIQFFETKIKVYVAFLIILNEYVALYGSYFIYKLFENIYKADKGNRKRSYFGYREGEPNIVYNAGF